VKIRRFAGIAVPVAIIIVAAWRVPQWQRNLARDGVAPYERFGFRAGQEMRAWSRLGGMAAENWALEIRVQELEAELLLLHTLRTDNAALRRQLDCAPRLPHHITAEVLTLGSADGWSQRIRISKGRRQGVRVNNPVVAAEGLVGRVVAASASTADVLLITDVNSRVACAFEPDVASARGILTGTGTRIAGPAGLQLLHTIEPLRLAYLEKELELPQAAKVVTSGIGGVYPRGIPVGVVAEVEQDASGLYQRATVVPFADFSSLRYVSVLVDASLESPEGGQP